MSQIYLTNSKLQIKLDKKLGRGGEGEVWTIVDQSNFVAKIYHSAQVTIEKQAKLEVMVSNPPDDKMRAAYNHISIAWPTDLLYQEGKFVGYLMPYISERPTALEIYNPQSRSQKYPWFNWKYLHHTALNFATALETLHASGYIMGDLNESNILVSDKALVTLIDTDSFQVRDSAGRIFRCPVGKPEYTPPELQRKDFMTVDRKPEHDYFGLAVLIFHFLMEGNHPFLGVLSETEVSGKRTDLHCLEIGAFPYDRQNGVVQPRPGALGLEVLHPNLQQLFIRCFVDGHNSPQVRPNPQAWREALHGAENLLVVCQKNSKHYYSNHLEQCPWCQREQRSNQGYQSPSKPPLQKPLPSAVSSSSPKPQPVQPLSPPPPSGGGTGIWVWAIISLVLLACGAMYGVINYSSLPSGEDKDIITATAEARMTATAVTRATRTAQAEEIESGNLVSSNSGLAKTATAQAGTATAQVKTATARAEAIETKNDESVRATARAEATATAMARIEIAIAEEEEGNQLAEADQVAIESVVRRYSNEIKIENTTDLNSSNLSQVLVDPALERQKRSTCWLENEGKYYTYSNRSLAIESVTFENDREATVLVQIGENRILRNQNGSISKDYGYDDYRAIYQLEKMSNDQWYINCFQALEDNAPALCKVTLEGDDPCR